MLRRLPSLLLVAALTLVSAHCLQGQADREGNVTVMLFQTEAVHRLHVDAVNATVRACERCQPTRISKPFDLEAEGNALAGASLPASRELRLDGHASIVTAGGHTATTAGHWRIEAEGGVLKVTVSIPLERYVAAVLAGETTPAEPAQSLRAMAVVVRSFAVAVAPRHAGGALCDSTHCQALRLGAIPETIRSAVWDTSGETLWYGSHRVPAYFSQHCGGFTEDATAAWQGKPQPWLAAHADAWCARLPSAWNAALSVSQVQQALATEGITGPVRLQDIAVLARDRSGRVQQLRMLLDDGSRKVVAASTLRFALNRSFGWNQLRSDRYQLRRAGDRFIFTGTGHGHGVGLCQAGAAEMARAGKSYRDILTNYFPGAIVRVDATDAGWQTVQASGFSLRSTQPNTTLFAATKEAYSSAEQRWGTPLPAELSVSVFASTEAYRQATGQPGWDLASTQGTRIATQPPAVMAAHGGAQEVLRHEFLHAAVEALAAPSAALWLREGLVEVLNHEHCPAATRATPQAVEQALKQAATKEQAHQAHIDACSLTAREVDRNGLAAAKQQLQRVTLR